MEFNFNVNDIKQDDAFPTIPTGAYKALIKETQIVDVKPKNGESVIQGQKVNQYLKLTWQIIDGPFKNRTIFENLNLFRVHNTESDVKTKGMAERKLAEICTSCGVKEIRGIAAIDATLRNKIMFIDIVQSVYNGNDSYNVTKHKSINGGTTLSTVDAQKTGLPFGN
jgi:hypothetical protein